MHMRRSLGPKDAHEEAPVQKFKNYSKSKKMKKVQAKPHQGLIKALARKLLARF